MAEVWIVFLFKFYRLFFVITGLPHITKTHVPFRRAVNEGVLSAGVELNMSYQFRELIALIWLKLNQVVGDHIVFDVP